MEVEIYRIYRLTCLAASLNLMSRSTSKPEVGPVTLRNDGQPIHPGDGVVLVMKEVAKKSLSIVGAGFYITRYGLFLTAKHVLEELAAENGASLLKAFVCHLSGDDKIYLRQIRRVHLLKKADIGIGQADNYLETASTPLMNLLPTLSTEMPPEGSPLVTYAYPENEVLDFNDSDQIPSIRGNYFQGGFLRYVAQSEHPFLRFPYFETSVEVRSGASGGPIFDHCGRIIGVNCRGWDFQGAEHEGNSLSYIVPVEKMLEIEVDPFLVPPNSLEAQQLLSETKRQLLTGRTLARFGHVLFDPAVR